MTQLLIITHEHIGSRMAGPGIRAWEIARAVAQHGFPVTLATPYSKINEIEDRGQVRVAEFSWDDPRSLEEWIQNSDVVMAVGPVLSRVIHWLGRPLELPTIVDLYYVPEIEMILLQAAHEPSFPIVDLLIAETLVYLSGGDFFLYATERQLDFWMGVLWMVGRLNPRTLLLDPERWFARVPMGIPDVPPRSNGPVLKGVVPGIGPQDKVVLWMGGIWEWTDPLTLAMALERVLSQRQDVRLVFGALQHYDPQIVPPMSKAARFLERCRESGWLGRFVFFLDWVPYERRGEYLLEADVGISLHENSWESRYAIRARSLDYLWASLPCVLSAGDELADLLAASGLAVVVPPRDPIAVAEALLGWLDSAPPRAELAARTSGLRETLRWSSVVRPIVEFLQQPRMAPDASMARNRVHALIRLRWENDRLREEREGLRRRIDELQSENDRLRSELDSIRRGRIVRALNGLYRLFGKRFL